MGRAAPTKRHRRTSSVPDGPAPMFYLTDTHLTQTVKFCAYTAAGAVPGVITLAILGTIYPATACTTVAIGGLVTIATGALATTSLYIGRIRVRLIRH